MSFDKINNLLDNNSWFGVMTTFLPKNDLFENTTLELNLEQISHDTYLKKFQPKSDLIKSENLMHSFLKLDGYNENSNLMVEFEVFEDLTKPTSDRYEFVYPNVKYSKSI